MLGFASSAQPTGEEAGSGSRLNRNQTALQRQAHELGRVLQAQLLQDSSAVIVDGLAASRELGRDLGGRAAFGQVCEYLELADREPIESGASARFACRIDRRNASLGGLRRARNGRLGI